MLVFLLSAIACVLLLVVALAAAFAFYMFFRACFYFVLLLVAVALAFILLPLAAEFAVRRKIVIDSMDWDRLRLCRSGAFGSWHGRCAPLQKGTRGRVRRVGGSCSVSPGPSPSALVALSFLSSYLDRHTCTSKLLIQLLVGGGQ